MRIAVSTEDGRTISGHLGHAEKFIIFDVEDGSIKDRFVAERDAEKSGDGCGCRGHRSIFDVIGDASAVITLGMGGGMASALLAAGVDPVMTSESDPERAVRAYLEGHLDRIELRRACGCGHHH